MKFRTIVLIAFVVVLGAIVVYGALRPTPSVAPTATPASASPTPSGFTTDWPRVQSPKEATYIIDGEPTTLVAGVARSGIGEKTALFGEPVPGDLNGDGRADAALMLTRDGGGSGTFFYAAAALDAEDGFIGTNAVLLGDRIAPQNVEVREGVLMANFAERREGEPMTAKPSIGVTKRFRIIGETLTEFHECSPQEKAAQMCTMDYRPVCGDDSQTYGNGCGACSASSVRSWVEGECK